MIPVKTLVRVAGAGGILAAGAYSAYAGWNWLTYGRPKKPCDPLAADRLLEDFLPDHEVVERHHIAIHCRPAIALAAACEMNLRDSAAIRAIFRAREILFSGKPDDTLPAGLLAQLKAMGWGILAETPGREIVFGAITRPWEPNVSFHSLDAAGFRAFHEPGWVKIAFTLRADPMGEDRCVFRTETRAVATDPESRSRFRFYWACLSPGIVLIRMLSLLPLKREAERRARAATRSLMPLPLEA
jgi:hypothetical protein